MTVVRAAMTETRNVYADMPGSVDDLATLADKLEDIRMANVSHHVELIAAAAAEGVRIVGLGELFPAPYFALRRDEFFKGMAESALYGPTITTMREVARARQMVIVAPIYELAGEERFNTAVVIDADGELIGRYRKSHIPRGRNEQAEFDEMFYYGPSRDQPPLPVFTTAVGRVGVSICYDRHFTGMVAGLAANGAEIIFSPAVTFGRKSRRLWDLEFEVDAARHRVFIGGSNRRGSEPPFDQEYFGASYFVGPGGRLENRSQHAQLIVSDLDLGGLGEPDESGWDLRRDARADI